MSELTQFDKDEIIANLESRLALAHAKLLKLQTEREQHQTGEVFRRMYELETALTTSAKRVEELQHAYNNLFTNFDELGKDCVRWKKIADQATAAVEELRDLCAQVYQAFGVAASDSGMFDTDAANKVLDNLSAAGSDQPLPHKDLLPYPCQPDGGYDAMKAAVEEMRGALEQIARGEPAGAHTSASMELAQAALAQQQGRQG